MTRTKTRKPKLKVPRKLKGLISQAELENVMERVAENAVIDRIVPQPEPKPALMSSEFDWNAAYKAFRVTDNKEPRFGLLMGQLAMCMPIRDDSADKAASLMK